METGTKISFVAHGTLIGLAVFGGPFLDADAPKPIQISEVSLLSSSEFEALSSRSPAPVSEVPELIQPVLPTEVVVTLPTPEAAAPPQQQPIEEPAPELEITPDVTGLTELVQPEIEVDSPKLAPQANDSTGNTLVVPNSPIAKTQTDGQRVPDRLALIQPKPRPAPRIDTSVAEKPPTDAEVAPEKQETTTPEATATEPKEKAEEKAPKEAATEIVSEPQFDPNSAAPAKSSRPRGRPRDIAKKAQQAKDKAEKKAAEAAIKQAKAAKTKAAREAKAADALAIREALIQATAEALNSAPNSAPSGPPLTSSERNGLVLAVQDCWNVPIGVQNASDLVVVLSVELSRDGKLVGSPKLIDPAGTPQGTMRQAFEAGRRALIRCAPYDLPQDKYEQWRQLEVVFNPKTMVVR